MTKHNAIPEYENGIEFVKLGYFNMATFKLQIY